MKPLLLLLLTGLILPSLSAQNNPVEKNRGAMSYHVAAGVQSQSVYGGFFAGIGVQYDKLFGNAGFVTGCQLIVHEGGGSVGVPVMLQYNIGQGLFALRLRGGFIVQHGFQPLMVPVFELRGRVSGRKRRMFVDFFGGAYRAYGYDCANGTYTCPNGPYTRDGWTTQPTIGIGIGHFIKPRKTASR